MRTLSILGTIFTSLFLLLNMFVLINARIEEMRIYSVIVILFCFWSLAFSIVALVKSKNI